MVKRKSVSLLFCYTTYIHTYTHTYINTYIRSDTHARMWSVVSSVFYLCVYVYVQMPIFISSDEASSRIL